jgi:hypothetical protein
MFVAASNLTTYLNFENGFDNNTYFSHVVASNLKTYLDFEYGFAKA